MSIAFNVALSVIGIMCFLLESPSADFLPQDLSAIMEMSKNEKHETHLVNMQSYNIDDSGGLGRTFDGIGGLSGGGATSRLLVSYPSKIRDEILDYLFKPNFAASLQLLKVEIGGDCQTTDGTEPSHLHSENETPNFNRGYEWWLMKEAKKRNPNIKLIGLPWGWPGWVGGDAAWPYNNLTKATNYITTWINGASSQHDLTIDYIGIWNERSYDSNYIKQLRKALDGQGLSHVAIIAADQSYDSTISTAMLHDPDLSKAVEVIGTHYPGTVSRPEAIETGKTLWSSEDYSTYNDDMGAGCWARILNQNYVNGNMTATIAWNLVASYYNELPFGQTSIMTANEPWSGNYVVNDVVWVTAHTTQFTEPGWSYLKTVGHLGKGGSYVALTDRKGALTIIVETMTRDRSKCIRPFLPPFVVEDQNVMFVLGGAFKNIGKLYSRHSYLGESSTPEQIYVEKVLQVIDGKVNLTIRKDSVVTLSTMSSGTKGTFDSIPPSATFPFPYSDDFDQSDGSTEAPYFADQAGVFEIFKNDSSTDGHKSTMRQVVMERPLTWCDDSDSPITVIGNHEWAHINVTVDVKLEDAPGIVVAARVTKGGCDVRAARGIFLWVSHGSWHLTTSVERMNHTIRCYSDWKCWSERGLQQGLLDWNTVSLVVDDSNAYGYLNSVLLFKRALSSLPDVPEKGWAAFGVETFAYAQFDNFIVSPA